MRTHVVRAAYSAFVLIAAAGCSHAATGGDNPATASPAPAVSNSHAAAPGRTGPNAGTFKRPTSKSVYLDSVPGGEGGPSPGETATRVVDGVAIDVTKLAAMGAPGSYNFRAVNPNDGAVAVRLAGRDADEFDVSSLRCGGRCKNDRLTCHEHSCYFWVDFYSRRPGRVQARLLVGGASYRLTGIVPQSGLRSASTSPSAHPSPSASRPASLSPSLRPDPSAAAPSASS
jgi:hypothetical protein